MLKYLEDSHPLSSWLVHRNLARQYDFMSTAFVLWQTQGRPAISLSFIGELNFYAAHHLSASPGAVRSRTRTNVSITDTDHVPPEHQEVDGWLEDFSATYSKMYEAEVPSKTAAYVLWRLNWIHPFSQGNGRTSRALAYFVLCLKYDKWFPGTPVHELIRRDRQEYCDLLRQADKTVDGSHVADLEPIQMFLERLFEEQINSVRTAYLSITEAPAAIHTAPAGPSRTSPAPPSSWRTART